ncbi:MAG TPA: glycine zipper family protein, partial [Burkholderiales bacterium]|nr:glycine zipper family protein [Burkholderiales bacterium]
LAGTGAAAQSGATAQHRYDMGYQQCMYAKGHKIPMAASRYDRRPASYREAAPPPPPPGTPPPPPPPLAKPPT